MKSLKRIFLTALLLSAPFAASADHTVGSGGDAIRALFDQARIAAAARLSQLKWCSFDSSYPAELVQWILQTKEVMALDIRSSSHLWVVDTQPTCAYTEHKQGAPLYLSYPTCINSVQTDLSKALFVVLHESAHHLGVSDEKQADMIASAILRASPQTVCPDLPNDPFNPQHCAGPDISVEKLKQFFKPGETTTIVDRYTTHARLRACTKMTGCGDWETAELHFSAYPNFSFKNMAIRIDTSPTSFKFQLWSQTITKFDSFFFNLANWAIGPAYPHVGYFYAESLGTGKKADIGSALSFNSSSSFKTDCAWLRGHWLTDNKTATGQYNEVEAIITGRH